MLVYPEARHDGQLVAFKLEGKAEELVASNTQYRSAPVTADQLKVGVREMPVAPSVGVESVGDDSGATVKEPVEE